MQGPQSGQTLRLGEGGSPRMQPLIRFLCPETVPRLDAPCGPEGSPSYAVVYKWGWMSERQQIKPLFDTVNDRKYRARAIRLSYNSESTN